MRIDVVVADEIAARAVVPQQVAGDGQAVLVRCRAGVDAVLREFEALVKRRVEQQRLPPLDHRQHRLARVRHMRAEQRAHAKLIAQGILS